MKEKKLTDDEIVKAFENCNNGGCRNCDYRNKKNKDLCYHKKINGEVILLIRRLQTENEHLKSLTENGELLKQLAIYRTKDIDSEKEIHRLQSENEGLKAKNKLDQMDIEDLHKEREKRVEEVYADFMQDYNIMREELNACQNELVKECKEHEEFAQKAKEEIEEWEKLFDISNERENRKKFNEEWKKEYQKELDKQGEGVIAGFPDADYVYQLYFEQKEEIERLTSLYDGKGGFMTSSIGDLPLTVEGLRKAVDEISRLLIVQGELQDFNAKYYNEAKDLRRKKSELQKQVDELEQRYLDESKERCKFEQLYEKKCHEHNIGVGVHRTHWEKKVQQAVKDTAKEIYTQVLEWLPIGEDYSVFIDNIEMWLKERYGVEVE